MSGDVTVWKYLLPVADETAIEMPDAARVLSVGLDTRTDDLAIWVQVVTDQPRIRRRFYVRGTGHPLGMAVTFVGTVVSGPFAWHVFDGGYDRPAS